MVEGFNSRFRDELLNSWRFDRLFEARVIIDDWGLDYSVNRPHSAHGDLTPTEFALQWTTTHSQGDISTGPECQCWLCRRSLPEGYGPFLRSGSDSNSGPGLVPV